MVGFVWRGRWPRLTVGRLMVLLAVVGSALGSFCWVEGRRARFRAFSAEHYGSLSGRLTVDRSPGRFRKLIGWDREGRSIEGWARRVDLYHYGLACKYDRAADRPWLPVEPDPPPPSP